MVGVKKPLKYVSCKRQKLHLVETGLGVEFAEGGDDERLGRPLGFQIGSVRRHRFWVGQRAHLASD